MDEIRLIEVQEGIFSENEQLADKLRSELKSRGCCC